MSLFWSKTYAIAILLNYCITVYAQNQTTPPKNVKRTQTEIKVQVIDENAKHDPQDSVASTNNKVHEDYGKAATKTTLAHILTGSTATADGVVEAEQEEYTITKTPEKGFFEIILLPIRQFIITILSAEKVTTVLRNIAICIINGGMDLAAYYFPAPLLPMFATMISYLVPIEPVVTLRRKLPVSSYRKAINTAVNSFLKSFDRYKIVVDDEYDDPYMTKRFNRRFNIDSDEMTHKVVSLSSTSTTLSTTKKV